MHRQPFTCKREGKVDDCLNSGNPDVRPATAFEIKVFRLYVSKAGMINKSYPLFPLEVCMKEKTYIAIDLKSFYASVECVERGLNPLDANLVVADESRTNKTICLAVSP